MHKNLLLIPAFALAATSAIAQSAPEHQDGPGPNMVIEVAAADGTPRGTITLDLLADKAPNHVARLVDLAKSGAYDGVVFHRVIDGFMAQTGDVEHGKMGGDLSRAGMGGSDKPDLPAEFSDVSFEAGTVGMARAQDPNSANSQFFIDLAPAPFLDGEYTVVGQIVDGWDVLNQIKKGDSAANGSVSEPDYMSKVTIVE
ncbi:peptidylprolyl isomerase [Paracoccus fistulariae]|uniref:Peptidyl-prolyl cis-trans isomerase n=1 Tax=Paracoccus fistulariae TaxID=658446 RepID=A0ABY7SMK8_9RHOB|nr:peptidylprolyl isomerase [Paracoccus fistulariae]MDB6180150.1 peptidylprolyl isomerase [Paracoccus fistulariae]WCR08234.1 peptidylprolyl isomerase [Paracoccus fistulariae]